MADILAYLGVAGLLDGRDIDLAHRELRLTRSLGTLRVTVAQGFEESRRRDLPRDAETILAPAALALLAAALEESGPVVVDLRLVGAADHQRERLVQAEVRARVECHVCSAVELELDRLPVVADDSAVGQHLGVELRGAAPVVVGDPQV